MRFARVLIAIDQSAIAARAFETGAALAGALEVSGSAAPPTGQGARPGSDP